MKEGKEIDLRSEEVQEILGGVPPWILRWGIVILSLVVFILLIGSWFFKYPDTITSTMTLTSSNPPARVLAKTSGKLMSLLVSDGQQVEKGQYLAVIENPASSASMYLLKKGLEKLILDQDSSLHFNTKKEMKLGSVQGTYSAFALSLNNYNKFIELAYYPQKMLAIEARLGSYQTYLQGMIRQSKLTQKQYRIAEKKFARDSILSKKEIISNEEIENSQSQLLQSNLAVENAYSGLENLQMQISQLQEDLLDIEQQYLEKSNSLVSELHTLAIQLMNEITTWEMTYVLLSPIDGSLTFTNYWSENQNVIAGEPVCTIIPKEMEGLMGKALLPIARSGKVKIGQKVNIHFLNYPDEEFGMVRGIVKNISLVPSEGNYMLEIALPQGLLTSYRRELPFSQEMQARADIITEDLRLIERFFLPLKRIFNENF